MKKLALLLILFPLFLTSCNKNKDDDSNVSVLEDSKSLINQWFGKGHFKDDSHPSKKCAPEEDSSPPLLTPAGLIVSPDLSVSSTSSTPPETQFFSQYLFTKTPLNLEDKEAEE